MELFPGPVILVIFVVVAGAVGGMLALLVGSVGFVGIRLFGRRKAAGLA